MSTVAIDYVIAGLKLPKISNENSDVLYDYMDTHEGVGDITVVIDGMCGDYVYIGEILAVAYLEDGEILEHVLCEISGHKRIEIARGIEKAFCYPAEVCDILGERRIGITDIHVYAFTHIT